MALISHIVPLLATLCSVCSRFLYQYAKSGVFSWTASLILTFVHSEHLGLCLEQRCPEIHLFGARFREQQGDVKGARLSYELLSSELAPGLLEAIIKHANFEQRQVHSKVRVIHVMSTNVY